MRARIGGFAALLASCLMAGALADAPPGVTPVAPKGTLASHEADVNGDGQPDLLLVEPSEPDLVVCLEAAAGAPARRTLARLQGNVRQLASGDIDADGRRDVVALVEVAGKGPQITWLDVAGPSGPVEHPVWSGDGRTLVGTLAVTDIDADGDVDVAAPLGAGSAPLLVLRNDGYATLSSRRSTSPEERINYYRGLVGIRSLTTSVLRVAAWHHAQYCALLDMGCPYSETEMSNPSYTGYSPRDRATAARYPSLDPATEEYLVAEYATYADRRAWPQRRVEDEVIRHLDEAMGSPAARVLLLQPDLRDSGFAYAVPSKRRWMDLMPAVFDFGLGPRTLHMPVPYPAPGQALVPTYGQGVAGFPVTLVLPQWAGVTITKHVLVEENSGAAVPYVAQLPKPGDPYANPDLGNAVALLPKSPLHGSTTYRATIHGSVEGRYGLAGRYPFEKSWVFTTANRAPATPKAPSGPSAGAVGETLTFQVKTTDPDGDSVRYTFEWGDGTTNGTALRPSGAAAYVGHLWSALGTYSLRVKATDAAGLESGWSPSVTVAVGADLSWIGGTLLPPGGPVGAMLGVNATYKVTGSAAPPFWITTSVFKYNSLSQRWDLAGLSETGTSGLIPGGTGTYYQYTSVPISPGEYKVEVELDSHHTIAEAQETNNVLTLSLTVPVPYAGIRNGDFELWAGSPAWPQDWSGSGKVWPVGGVGGRGRAAMLGAARGAIPWPPGTDTGYATPAELWQSLSVDYSSVEVSVYARAGDFDPATPPRVELGWYDATGRYAGTSSSYPIRPSTSWALYRFTAYKPGDTPYARIRLLKPAAGYVVFDRVVVAGGPPY